MKELTKNEILEFLELHQPSFSISGNASRAKFCMFTIPTQHIYANSIEDLIQDGIQIIKEKPMLQYPTIYQLLEIKNEDLIDDQNYHFRISEHGTMPHHISGSGIKTMKIETIKFNKYYKDVVIKRLLIDNGKNKK